MARWKLQIGLTLTELIIATAMLSIVIFGIFSSNLVFEKMGTDNAAHYQASSSADSILSNILNNAVQAIGSNSTNDKGILIGAGDGIDANSICIHQDVNSNLSASNDTNNNTPADTSDDRWLCYTRVDNQVYYCADPYMSGSSRDAAPDACTNAGIFLGTATGWVATFPTNDSDGNPQPVFDLTITSRPDPSKDENAATNPDKSSEGSVSPPGHSLS